MQSPTVLQKASMPATDASIDRRLLDYIAKKGAVSFDGIYDYMVATGLHFGAAASPIEILGLKAQRGEIDVDYDLRMIYMRKAAPTPTPAAIVTATAAYAAP